MCNKADLQKLCEHSISYTDNLHMMHETCLHAAHLARLRNQSLQIPAVSSKQYESMNESLTIPYTAAHGRNSTKTRYPLFLEKKNTNTNFAPKFFK